MSDPRQERHRAVLYQAASMLLEWPDPQLIDRLPLLRAVAADQPAPAGAQLTPLLERLSTESLVTVQADYVETFDLRRRCCLYLTYYAFGDTRKRGMALLAFKRKFKRAGVVLTQDELPDHLCVLLEFAATVDPEVGRQLLLENRAGLELLRLALQDRQSPYTGVLAAISSTLPTLRGDERAAVAKLVAQGPPGEEVGLEPFGPPPVGLGARA